jgi:hypothetical protein
MRLSVLAAALCLAAAPAAAGSFRAVNGLLVVPEGGRSFGVPFQGLSNNHEFWCAAGDYVRRRLGLPGRTPIYLLSELPRQRGQGLRFSLDPEGAAARTGVSSFGGDGPGNSVSANTAYNLCPVRIPPFGLLSERF